MDNNNQINTTPIWVTILILTILLIFFIIIWFNSTGYYTRLILAILSIIFFIIILILIIYYFIITDRNVKSPGTDPNKIPPSKPPPQDSFVRYGDTLSLLHENSFRLEISPCDTMIPGINVGITLRTDASFLQNNGVINKLRLWNILSASGISSGTQVKYGDKIYLQSQAVQFPGFLTNSETTDLPPTGCGFIINLNPTPFTDISAFTVIRSNSNTSTDTNVNYGDLINLTQDLTIDSTITRLTLSICGTSTEEGCGVNVRSRTLNSPNLLPNWTFERSI